MTETNSQALTNPIADADFEAIDRLFNKDPQFLTEEDIETIVQKLRSGRGRWLHETEKKAAAKKKLSKEESKDLLASLNLSF
jgi:hypothetical protein